MRTIALVNQKGGCGKTTTAVNLAYSLAAEGKQVLLIDLDPQGHAGLGLGVQPGKIEKSIYEVLLGRIKIDEAVYVINPKLHIVLSDILLSAFEQVMSGAENREHQLERSLGDLSGKYDFLILDCPPSIGLLTFNALMVAGEVIVPVDSSSFSLHGLSRLLKTLELLNDKKSRLFSLRILPSNMDDRTRYAKQVIGSLRKNFPDQCFDTVIHSSIRLKEAAGRGKPVTEYDKHCRSVKDYRHLAREVMKTGAVPAEAELPVPPKQPLEKIVVFDLDAPSQADVRIAGDFNNWNPETLFFSETFNESRWQKRFSLKPGSYRYKYLLDGQWISDPENDKTVDDSFGGSNSLINI